MDQSVLNEAKLKKNFFPISNLKTYLMKIYKRF
jgi:hypothetical protein